MSEHFHSSRQSAASEQVQQDMLMELQPIFTILAVTSTLKTSPGDKYLAKLTFLKNELGKVQAAHARSVMAGSMPAAPVEVFLCGE